MASPEMTATLSASPPRRFSGERRTPSFPSSGTSIDEKDITQGRVCWLPPKEELPERAVRRAHGKGVIEEGIYNHPIVVVSRPADEHDIVHFHLITSFQGKKLHEIYGKDNEFHASRRSWYLPISPSPDHPDATSKKAKKRFPTLELASSASLRWDSYVNIRHIYKIQGSLLWSYANPDTPYQLVYRLERESTVRMLAKGKVLTTYEVGTQLDNRGSKRSPKRDSVAEETLGGSVAEETPDAPDVNIQENSEEVHPAIPVDPGDPEDPKYPQPPLQPSVTEQESKEEKEPLLEREPVPRRPKESEDEGGGLRPSSIWSPARSRTFSLIRYIFGYLLRWPWNIVERLWARVRSYSDDHVSM